MGVLNIIFDQTFTKARVWCDMAASFTIVIAV